MKTLVEADIHDIRSGRGNFINGCSGNKLFRELVKQIRTEYVATDKKKKREFTQVLVASLKSLDPPARFLGKEQNNRYLELSDKEAIAKARQALREGAPEIEKWLKNGTIVVEEFDFAPFIKAKIELVYKQGRCVAEELGIPNQPFRPKVSEAQQIEAIKNAAAAMCSGTTQCQNPEKIHINISPIKPISIHTPHGPEERNEPCLSRKSTESESQIGSEIEFQLQNDNAVSESTIPTNNLYRDTKNDRDFYSNLRPKINLTLSNPFAQRKHEQQGQQDHYNFYSEPVQLDSRQLYQSDVNFPPQGHSVESDSLYVDHQSCTFQSQYQRYTTQKETYSGSQMQQGREYVEIDEDLLSCSLASKLSLNDDGSWLRSSNNSGKMSLASKKTITSTDLFRHNFMDVGDAFMNSDLKDDSLHNLQDPLQIVINARNETLLQGNADLTSALHGDETTGNLCNDRARTLSLLNNVLEPRKDWIMNGDDDNQSLGSISTLGQDEISLENNTHIYNSDMLRDLELKFGSSVSNGTNI